MPAALSQSPDAAMPDAPGRVGLHALLTSGLGGAQLDLAISPINTAHTRILFSPQTLTSGSVQLMGLDAGGGETGAWLEYDAVSSAVSLHTAQGLGPSAVLPPAIAWHCLELAVDPAAGSAALIVNGIAVGETVGLSLSPISRAWLGAIHKQTDTTGAFFLDDWVISESHIGPLLVSPVHDHAGDSTRWLVVYNRDVPESIAWAEDYRAKRSIPYANLCGLSLPTLETIDMVSYLAMRDSISTYLDDNGLASQVMGILLGMGVPGYVDTAGQGDLTPVMSLLHTQVSNDLITINPHHRNDPGERVTSGSLLGVLLTARIDGADLVEANAFVDRAIDLAQTPIESALGGTLWYDPIPEGGSINPVFSQPMLDWIDSESRQKLRLDFEVAGDTAFPEIHDDVIFWGWGQAVPPIDFFSASGGRRALCIQLESANPPATSMRDAQATHWIRAAVEAGYAAAVASSRAYTLSALPQPTPFFGALREGWTLAEAWLIAQPFLRSGLQLIGDPLMTLALPKAGVDVLGPAVSIEQIDLTAPIVRLPNHEKRYTLDQAALPISDDIATYLIRQLDEHGRDDAGSAILRRLFVAGAAHEVPVLPAWPEAPNWRIDISSGIAFIPGLWAKAPSLDGATKIALEAMWPDDSITEVLSETPSPGRRRWEIEHALDAVPRTYRWRVDRGPVSLATPWSANVSLSTVATTPIVLLETS